MKFNYTRKTYAFGESQIKFTNVTDMNALIREIENELADIRVTLYLANPGGDNYKDEYQLRMDSATGTARIDVSLTDDTLIIRASEEQINLLDKLFQKGTKFEVKD